MSTNHSVGLSQAELLPPPGSGGLLYLVGISDMHLWYTEPASSTSWQVFDDMEFRAGVISTIVDADVNKGLLLSVFAVNNAGGMYFTYFTGSGWVPFSDVKPLAGNPGDFSRVAVTTSTNLDVCGITSDGRVWHAMRLPTSLWVPFFDVMTQAGNPGPIVQIGCAGVGADLNLCAISDDGRLWLTTRSGFTGVWSPFVDVETLAGKRGSFIDVDCANLNGELHVFAATKDGNLWHAIRGAGTWTPFDDIKARAGDPGAILRVGAGGGAPKTATLQLAVVTRAGGLFHTDRDNTGSWSPFADVEATAGDRGDFIEVGLDAYVTP